MSDVLATIVILALLVSIASILLKVWEWNHVRKFSLSALEQSAFLYENEYFDVLGHDEESVTRFRKLVEAHDLDDLLSSWRSLEKDFRRLERKAGHTGRPLILDYYAFYRSILSELRRRRRRHRA